MGEEGRNGCEEDIEYYEDQERFLGRRRDLSPTIGTDYRVDMLKIRIIIAQFKRQKRVTFPRDERDLILS